MKRERIPAGGFSAIEVMTVLVIMGIVLAAAVPNVTRYMRHDQVRMAAESFQSHCMVAQQRTMASRVPHRVVYDPGSASYRTERQESGLWEPISADSTALDPGLSMNGGTDTDPSHHVITFEPRGTITMSDVPATVLFTNGEHDSSWVRLVRTGRMVVHHR